MGLISLTISERKKITLNYTGVLNLFCGTNLETKEFI